MAILSRRFLTVVAALAGVANGALQRVRNFGDNPTNLEMNINVPRRLADNPAIVLALHGCGGSGESYARQTRFNTYSETRGFITIFPSSKRDFNCWEVNTAKGLSRDAGGDNQGLANMIKYTIAQHGADPAKVFITGSSSGCMMTNVMMGTYPDLFAAASCYSGVPAGCLAGSPGASPISADPKCANGQNLKSQSEWVSIVKAMYPGYNGPYPRMQTWHGTSDSLVTYPNLGEQLEQWSGIHDVAFASNATNTPERGYTKMVYGDGSKVVGYSAQGVGHVVPQHETDDLAWFGL